MIKINKVFKLKINLKGINEIGNFLLFRVNYFFTYKYLKMSIFTNLSENFIDA